MTSNFNILKSQLYSTKYPFRHHNPWHALNALPINISTQCYPEYLPCSDDDPPTEIYHHRSRDRN
jgi:hypothetical protein